MCWRNILFYMREYIDAIKLPKSYPLANGMSVQYVNVLPILWSHFWNFSLHIVWNFFSNFCKILHLTFFFLIALVYSFIHIKNVFKHIQNVIINVISLRAVRFMYKIYKKGALDSQPQVIKFTSCFPVVGGSLRLLPPLKLVAMI